MRQNTGSGIQCGSNGPSGPINQVSIKGPPDDFGAGTVLSVALLIEEPTLANG